MKDDFEAKISLNSAGRLDGVTAGILRDLLADAFTSPNRFNDLLVYRLGKEPIHYFAGMADNYKEAVGAVIRRANAELWWRDLLRGARNMVPADPELLAFAERVEMGPLILASKAKGSALAVVDSRRELELKIKAARTSFDVLTWRRRLGEIEARICRVEFPEGQPRGTGLLIGPDLVLTNFHVIEKVHRGEVPPTAVRLRFDYKVLGDGVAVSSGKAYALSSDWLADESPYSKHDLEVVPTGEPGDDELDYAILRVDGQPGKDPVGGDTSDPSPVDRGWIERGAVEHDFKETPALYIVQHPGGRPMQVAVDTEAFLSLNPGGTRVRYTTETEPGSSGSPCFGADWTWVALHHSGDPKYWKLGAKPDYNEGIPVAAIAKLLASRGKGSLLGAR